MVERDSDEKIIRVMGGDERGRQREIGLYYFIG